jgi:hypothetical protein
MTETTVETVEATSVQLEPTGQNNLFRTSDPVEVLAQAKRVAQALKDEIEAAGMVQRIGGREFVRVEGIQTGSRWSAARPGSCGVAHSRTAGKPAPRSSLVTVG